MTRIFRATTDLVARTGACFAEREVDARAYLDNPGFGGPTLAAYDVDGDVFDADDCRDLADAYLDLLTEDERAELASAEIERAEIVDAFRDCGGLVFHALEGHRGFCRRAVPALTEVLARGYAWVRYTDDYPVGCVTRMYLGAAEIHPAEVL